MLALGSEHRDLSAGLVANYAIKALLSVRQCVFDFYTSHLFIYFLLGSFSKPLHFQRKQTGCWGVLGGKQNFAPPSEACLVSRFSSKGVAAMRRENWDLVVFQLCQCQGSYWLHQAQKKSLNTSSPEWKIRPCYMIWAYLSAKLIWDHI